VNEALAGRLAWITGLRLAFLTLLLVATTFFYLGGELSRYAFSVRVVFGTIGAAFALAAIYAGVLRSKRKLWLLAQVQIVLDQLTWTAIVYVSGGATSGATSFYGLTCLVGAILIGVRGAAIAAVSGLGFYWLLCAGFHFHTIAAPPDQPATSYATAMSALSYPLLVNGLGILVVAVLGGYLAERLRVTGGELQEATVRARRAEQLAELGRIAAWLAHEVRNPLGSIKGSIEMLRESSALSTEDKQLCDIVHREAARLNDLVGDMLDLSKPRSPDPTDVDVAALAREVVELARREQPGNDDDARVTIAYAGAEGSAIARCDGAQIRQVLWNLVRNAVQASPAGTKVTVEVEAVAGGIALRVADSGPGISDEAKKRIFDAFYTTRSHGAGIGLAVVQRIVDEHAAFGARISVDNLEGRGAEFRVYLRSAGPSAR
jgi:two-component system, NtrC family, sensor histidine kinase HydH